jgi:hypothetical protein
MAGIGFGKKTPEAIAEKTFSETVAHNHVPGRAYNIADPVVKLVNMVGGGFFNEPKYYDPNRPALEFWKELVTTGKISSTPKDADGLTAQAKELLETAMAVANGSHPEDLLIVSAWMRDTKDGLKLRTTPQILLALAAQNPKTKEFVRKYTPSIIKRADEIRQVFAAYRHLFQGGNSTRHKGVLPHSLRKGLAQAFADFSTYDLLKYDSDNRPSFKDVLLMIDRAGKQQGYPLSKPLFEYFVNRKITADAPEMLKARQEFFNLKGIEGVTPDLIKRAGLTWENIKSKAGQLAEDDDSVQLPAKVWELCVPIMGEMALTRNLRNLEQAKVSSKVWDIVYEKLEKVERTNQLPFRFFAADKEVTSTEAKTAVAQMLDRACASLPDLAGMTAVFTDNSGSAVGATISGKSNMRVSDCGNTLEAVFAKRYGRRAMIGVFGDSFMWVPFSQADSALSIKKKIDSVAQREERSTNNALAIPSYKKGAGVGGGTETGLWFGIDDLIKRKVHVDRIVLLSDLCCYTQGDVNCGTPMSPYFGAKATIQSMIDRYRREVNKDCRVYSINLAGYGQAQTRPTDEKSHILSGWSENIIRTINDLESGVQPTQDGKAVELPTIEVLRRRYAR